AISARTSSDTSLCLSRVVTATNLRARKSLQLGKMPCWSVTDGAAPGHEPEYPAVSSCLMALLSPDTVRRNTSAAATRWTRKSKITSYNRHQFERSTL